MRIEQENSKNQRESNSQPTRDRLDWISKYLELADRVMENHPPERAKESSEA
jgi:hypothetical protein